jgi:allantoinase
MTTALYAEQTLVDGRLMAATLRVQAGKIVAIEPGRSDDADDLGSGVLMAGLVDTHVHINEPGRTDWEGFATATRAAAAGGITTVVDMPLNCIPVTTTPEALATKLEVCAPLLHVDCGFWGGVIPANAADLGGLASSGVLGAKCFLVHSGIDDFPQVTADHLRDAMPVLRDAGLRLLVHAELDLGEDPSDLPPQAYARFLASRPARWEDAAIALMIDLCRTTNCPVHIVHLSSAGSLEQLAAAKAEGLPITAETCPHYLCLNAEAVPDGATAFKCCPPIRDRANQELLWKGLADGTIDFVTSDHSPCTPHLKLPDEGDFMGAWGGIASLQLGLRTIWTAARSRGFGLEDLSYWLSERPAQIAGINERKGKLAIGYDADLVLWSPDAIEPLTAEHLHHRHKISPYLGQELFGKVQRTWLRGQCIYDNGSFAPASGKALMSNR